MIKKTLILLLFVAGLFDIWTTLAHINFIGFESNPVYVFSNSIFLMVLVKFGLLFLVAYFLWIADTQKPFIQFFWTYFCVLLVVMQLFAGISNIYVKNTIKNRIEEKTALIYDDISEIPLEEIQNYYPEKKELISANMLFNAILLMLPIFITLISFKLWELMYFNKNNI